MIEKQTREPFAIPAAEGGGWMDTYEALRKIASIEDCALDSFVNKSSKLPRHETLTITNDFRPLSLKTQNLLPL
ncbi:hypothetical protein MJO28_003666 [Puccinia striiformis f. sp. tritici]|uniref:Uncharacterized protein n=1 Tax=Puccinia striiformis f. sp. tritici TaxID=168172 RepID=A0ACC0EMD2_9BASI|nr:hypothetical protein MJO28_003666 [Puccinia striiformis f. sp. tritici]